MDKVTKFLTLFSDFDLVVKEKRKTTLKKATVVNPATAGLAGADLKKELKRLQQEYRRAHKSFKHGKMTRQELFDFEWRIFELQEEIRRIEEDDLI
tara:strand:- start:2064 stop:2351 length:288 start_codon:yes stop_codon:yes gene_type:complete